MKQLLKLDEVYEVESSNIDRVGWQGEDAYVAFKNGNVYKYPKTPRNVFDDLLKAKSVGKTFSQTLRKADTYEQLDAVIIPNEDNNEVEESETIEILIKYKGKEAKVQRKFSKALVRLKKDLTDIQVREASEGAMKAMRDVLKLQENQ